MSRISCRRAGSASFIARLIQALRVIPAAFASASIAFVKSSSRRSEITDILSPVQRPQATANVIHCCRLCYPANFILRFTPIIRIFSPQAASRFDVDGKDDAVQVRRTFPITSVRLWIEDGEKERQCRASL